jgi:6-pyruvoyltetrahydropterin/6-carboxytetrahydropterin synthase
VVEPLDHTFLNHDVEYFRRTIPTCENVALYIHAELVRLQPQFAGARLLGVRVWESDDLYAEAGEVAS